MPSTPFIGVRISWLIVARNVDFASLAASASARAVSAASVRSRNSSISRAFSIAMTACAAKFSSSAISFSENGRTSRRTATICPRSTSSLRRRDAQQGAAARLDRGAHHRPESPARSCVRSGMWTNRSPSSSRIIGCPERKAVALPQSVGQRLRMTAHRDRAELLPVIGLKATMGNAAQRASPSPVSLRTPARDRRARN